MLHVNEQKLREETVTKLGQSEKVEELRRDFVSLPPRYVDAIPPVESKNK
jgi:hypothetical protein